MKRVPAERGVTLAELLVTIVLVGIFFAALVPVFVQAAQTSAGDNARTVALGIAQDKMERIRSLPYDDVETANLYADTARGLGHHASAASGGKDYLVDYAVEYIYEPGSVFQEPGLELYKLVTVDVYWEGNPRPVKHVRLRTTIYRQYAGPVILSVQVTPRSETGGTAGMIVPGADHLVTITAFAMTGAPIKEVRFALASGDGSYTQKYTQEAGSGGAYVWTWDAEAAPDGFYKISATAVSPGGYLGNTWRLVEQLETGSPPAPTDFTATPGDQSVALHWQQPAAGDIDYYEVWRSQSDDRASAVLIATDLTAVDYPDLALTNDTTYYYWVYAIDLVGNVSGAAAASATPSLSAGDHTPPTTPTLSATIQSAAVALSWSPSNDPTPPDPPSGIGYYEIYRSIDGATYSFLKQVDATAVSFSDPVGTDSPRYWYEIRAVDASPNANRSAFSAPVGPLQTPATVTTLTVSNDRTQANKSCTVTVQDVVTRLYYDQNGVTSTTPPVPAVTIASQGGSAEWHNLPLDKTYTVTATYSSGNPKVFKQSAPPWTISFK